MLNHDGLELEAVRVLYCRMLCKRLKGCAKLWMQFWTRIRPKTKIRLRTRVEITYHSWQTQDHSCGLSWSIYTTPPYITINVWNYPGRQTVRWCQRHQLSALSVVRAMAHQSIRKNVSIIDFKYLIHQGHQVSTEFPLARSCRPPSSQSFNGTGHNHPFCGRHVGLGEVAYQVHFYNLPILT